MTAGAVATARSTLEQLVAGGVEPATARARLAAGVAVAVAAAEGVRLPRLRLLEAWGEPVAAALAPGEVAAGRPAAVYEALLDPGGRRRRGAFYTPAAVAGAVAGWALELVADPRPVVADPAAGGGAFLLAAAEQLAAGGLDRAEVVRHLLVGVDVDPVAAAVTEAVLALWCRGAAVPRVVVGDALCLGAAAWPERPHVVVGNPPFLSQLARSTARCTSEVEVLRARFGPAVTAYVDTAVLFLALAVELVRPGGAVALVLPESFLASRDAGPARRSVLAGAGLRALWVPAAPVFDSAAVRVCVPVLARGPGGGGVVQV
ncbi:MAG TPA: N-6 DNA methylase, partial [Acidimicrobiales bacterium]|nr:N-6 DNA methylase [Acidimicrobiales bacterium]